MSSIPPILERIPSVFAHKPVSWSTNLMGWVLIACFCWYIVYARLDGLFLYQCFMDANLWNEATVAIQQGNWTDAAITDRPPLYPILSAITSSIFAISTQEALFYISTFFWTLSLGLLWHITATTRGIIAGITIIVAMLYTHTFNFLAVWTNAQSVCNCLIIVFIWYSYSPRSPTLSKLSIWWHSMGTGCLLGLLPATKEQGLIFVPIMAMHWIWRYYKTPASYSILGFFLGLCPPLFYALHWYRVSMVGGSKWQTLQTDLPLLAEKSHWSTIQQGGLNLQIIQKSDQYLDLAWNIFLSHNKENTLWIFLLVLMVGVSWYRRKTENTTHPYSAGLLCGILTAIPFVFMPLFLPYHTSYLTPLAICYIVLGIDGMLPSSFRNRQSIGNSVYLLIIVTSVWRGTYCGDSLSMETSKCINGRFIPVINWMNKNVSRDQRVFATDPWVKHLKYFTGRTVNTTEAQQGVCAPKTILIRSIQSPVSNLPNNWKELWKRETSIQSPNNEKHEIWLPRCDK